MKLNKLLLVLVLSLPLVLGATTVDTDKDIYAPGETAIISGVCSTANLNVGLQVLLGANAVWVDEAKSDATKKYSKSFLPSQKGKYTAYAACTGDAAANAAFCVGTQDECAPKIAEKEEPKPSSGSGGGSGGGCTPVYVCGDWGFCNASLQQKRICTDQIACKSNKIEVQSCPKCQESWVCSLWSDCTGSQSRTCTDEHRCGTSETQPDAQRACTAGITAPTPSYQPPSYQPPTFKPELQQPAPAEETFWDKYQWLIISGIVLLLAIGGGVGYYLWKKRQGGAGEAEAPVEEQPAAP